MENALLKKLFQVKEGSGLKINGRTFTVQQKIITVRKGPWGDDPDDLHLDLGDHYSLNVENNVPKFFQVIPEKGWIFTRWRSKHEKIETIELQD